MHAWFVGNRRDLAAGILMTLIGIGAMMQGAAYRVGSLTKDAEPASSRCHLV